MQFEKQETCRKFLWVSERFLKYCVLLVVVTHIKSTHTVLVPIPKSEEEESEEHVAIKESKALALALL
jgi:hypothetical protein